MKYEKVIIKKQQEKKQIYLQEAGDQFSIYTTLKDDEKNSRKQVRQILTLLQDNLALILGAAFAFFIIILDILNTILHQELVETSFQSIMWTKLMIYFGAFGCLLVFVLNYRKMLKKFVEINESLEP